MTCVLGLFNLVASDSVVGDTLVYKPDWDRDPWKAGCPNGQPCRPWFYGERRRRRTAPTIMAGGSRPWLVDSNHGEFS